MDLKPKQYYFPNLYRKNKFLFWIVCIFFLLHINANFFVGGQQSPFYYWSLYAAPVQHEDIYFFYEARYNGDKKILFPQTWRQPQRLFYLNTLNHYVSMRIHNNHDPLLDYINNWNTSYPLFADMFPGLKFYDDSVEMNELPDWYAKKIEQYTGDSVYSIDAYKIEVRYLQNGKVQNVSSEFLFKIK